MKASEVPTSPAEWVPINSVKPFPGNPKIGDISTIRQSIRVNGMYRPLYVQRSTNCIIAGNHTWEAAKAEGHTGVWVWMLDVDDEQAKRINLVDNRSAELGGYNEEALLEMLGSLPSLEGTGWSQDDMLKLLGEAPAAPVDDVPVPDDSYQPQLGVIVLCESTEQQQAVYEQLQAMALTNPAWTGAELKVVAV